MQNLMNESGKLLNSNGELIEKGYAKNLIKEYNKNDIKAKKFKIKEWDYYLIYNNSYGLALTIDDNYYMGLCSITLLDFKNKSETTKTFMKMLTKGKTNMPSTSKIGDVSVINKNYELHFYNDGTKRRLIGFVNNFNRNKETISFDFIISKEPKESMVIATPFLNDPKSFYYNQKIIGMQATGIISLGTKDIEFKENSFALLDWGRGVWPYKNTWYWGAGQGIVNGKIFGFNIGYGFGDTSKASENMLFYNNIAYKIEDVIFNIPKNKYGKNDYLSPWTFESSDKRFEMKFTPIIDRKSKINIGILCSDQHQVFGYFDGKVVLDDNNTIVIDKLLGFAERVYNKW